MASPTTADAPALSYSSAPGRWVLAITVLSSGIAALHCGLEALTTSVSRVTGT